MPRSAPATPTSRSSARRPTALDRQLDAAAAHCAAHGAQLTALRREVLRLLLQRGGSAKAYDLQDDMRVAHGRAAPMTVYRALDFLIGAGLVHRVDSLNTFVVCSQHDHADGHPHDVLMLACTRCGAVSEQRLHEPMSGLTQAVEEQFGFRPHAVEVKGVCRSCQGEAGRLTE